MNEKILVTGANGLLGQHLIKLLLHERYTVVGTGRGSSRLLVDTRANFNYYDVDITDAESTAALLAKEQPPIVVHAAAMTQVDECEMNQSSCEAVNVYATAALLAAAETWCRHFIYISTDFVFDGEQGDYKEDDHLSPIN